MTTVFKLGLERKTHSTTGLGRKKSSGTKMLREKSRGGMSPRKFVPGRKFSRGQFSNPGRLVPEKICPRALLFRRRGPRLEVPLRIRGCGSVLHLYLCTKSCPTCRFGSNWHEFLDHGTVFHLHALQSHCNMYSFGSNKCKLLRGEKNLNTLSGSNWLKCLCAKNLNHLKTA